MSGPTFTVETDRDARGRAVSHRVTLHTRGEGTVRRVAALVGRPRSFLSAARFPLGQTVTVEALPLEGITRRYYCTHEGDPLAGHRHTRGDGTPTRARCEWCRGALVVQRGAYGTVLHSSRGRRGAGVYYPHDALGFYRTRALADAAAVALGPEYVSRWFAVEAGS